MAYLHESYILSILFRSQEKMNLSPITDLTGIFRNPYLHSQNEGIE